MNLQGSPPFLKTPFTDLYNVFGGVSLQNSRIKQCELFESNYLNCLQAHGFDKGLVLCKDYYEDLRECRFGNKEAWRIDKIREQREKMYKEGKIKDRYFEITEIDAHNPPNY